MAIQDKEQDSKYNPAEKHYGTSGSPDGSHDDLGVHPERQEAENAELEKLYNDSPSGSKQQKSSKQEQQESDQLSNNENEPQSGWKTITDKKGRKFRFNRRKAAASGGVIGVLLGGGIGFFSFISGPLQFIQMAQVFQGIHMDDILDFSDGRAGKLLRYSTKGVTGSNAQDRNLGAAGNKIAVHYENKLKARGIELRYNNPGRLSEILIDPNSNEGKRLITEIEADTGEQLDTTEDGKRRVDLATESGNTKTAKIRRSYIERSVKASGINRVSGAISSRMLKARAGVGFHPLKNIPRGADEDLRLRYDEYQKRRTDNVRDGTQSDSTKLDVSSEDPENPDNQPDRTRTGEVSGVSDEIASEAKDSSKTFNERVDGVRGKLKAGVGVTALVSLACGVQEIGKQSAVLQEANVVRPLIRTGMDAMITGNQIMAGQDVSIEELGALSESFYDEETQTAWVEAQSILAEQGKEGGKPIPKSAIPGKDKPGFFKAIDSAVEFIPGGPEACGAVTSVGGQIFLTVAGIAASFTGPLAAGVQVASEVVQDQIVGIILPNLVRWLAGEAVDIANFAGADYGSIANYGAFLAANNQMKGMGGRALDDRERLALDNARRERIKNDMSTQSFYARILKPTEPNSLFASSVLGSPSFQSTNSTVASISQYPASLFSNLSSSFRSLIPGASAQAAPFDYGVSEYGFSLGEINSPDLKNPYENAEIVEPNLETYNTDYGEVCFGTTIDPSSGKINYTEAPSYLELEKQETKDTCTSPDATRYRMYIADMISMKSITCYEGIDEAACSEVGLSSSQEADITAPTGTGAKGVDTSAQTCSIGEDGGIQPTPDDNIKIRICIINGIDVNVSIEQKLKAILDGTSAAGIELGGGGYRSYQEQIRLRGVNGCPDTFQSPASTCRTPTAIPGNSNHEWGLAIDFKQNGEPTYLRRGSTGFSWLRDNEANHGLINLPSEPWHWSVDGS